ncbi:MAG: ribosomal RNA small subunit methyltransferase A [Nitrososphaerota archaeon]|nr:ribosomal RNA small subunit methyltransferase A [Nitrososphaerota archaeon]
MNPRRFRFGQHSLASQQSAKLLADRASLRPEDTVFEIGTGHGMVTRELALRVSFVRTHELDDALCEEAAGWLPRLSNVELVRGDALKHDAGGFDAVVSSLPYYISSRFITWFCAQKTPRAAVILQKEFVDKLLARPGSAKYGPYSVVVDACFQATPLDVLPPAAFDPRPKVFSQIMSLHRKREMADAAPTVQALKTLFSFRGKTVGAAIKHLSKRGSNMPQEGFDRAARVAELEPPDALRLAISIRDGAA